MSVYSTVRGWLSMLFPGIVKEKFNVLPQRSKPMEELLKNCANIYAGKPDWVDEGARIKTVNFAKAVCSETARLATLDVKVTIDGSARATWLQEQMDDLFPKLRHWTEYGCAFGTVITKPSGNGVDLMTPGQFEIIDVDGGKVTGATFQTSVYDNQREKWYTRLEYHRFEDSGTYAITNYCFEGGTKYEIGRPVAIEQTPWAGLLEEAEIEGLEHPLFSVFMTPEANNVDIDSQLGLPIFAGAIEELKDLDIAYSRNAEEVEDSARTVIMDSDMLLPFSDRSKGKSKDRNTKEEIEKAGLPKYVRAIQGGGNVEIYHEINPTLNTGTRLEQINSLLSQIGFKCGYSNGYFVFNEKTGMVTATQVESDDRRTVQTIKDIRDKLETCLDGLVYALDKFADLYDLAPAGPYEVTYDFRDLTYNEDEDRMRWNNMANADRIPFWYYLVKFEGMSEDEAKALTAEARPTAGGLFGNEE